MDQASTLLSGVAAVGLTALFAIHQYESNHEQSCREFVQEQENVAWVKENAAQNDEGDYVFSIGGNRCSVPLPTPSQG